LQLALAEAIDENEIVLIFLTQLRRRVIELEALLVAAQMHFEELTEREERKEGSGEDKTGKLKMNCARVHKS
jgi:hypothetical protein